MLLPAVTLKGTEVAYLSSAEERFTKVNKLELIAIELVKCYKYLGLMAPLILNHMCWTLQGSGKWKEVGRKRLKLGFYLRNKLCFSLNVRKYIIAATFFFFYLCWSMGTCCTCMVLLSVSIWLITFTIHNWGWSQIGRLWLTTVCYTLG